MRLSVARLQSAGAGSDLKTKSSTLGVHLSMHTAAAAAAAVSHIVKHKIPRHVDRALGTSLRRQTRGSQRWLGRLGPTRSAAHPARPFAAPDHNNSSWSRRLLESFCPYNKYDFFAWDDGIDLVSSHLKKRSGQNPKLKKSNRVGNSLIIR